MVNTHWLRLLFAITIADDVQSKQQGFVQTDWVDLDDLVLIRTLARALGYLHPKVSTIRNTHTG